MSPLCDDYHLEIDQNICRLVTVDSHIVRTERLSFFSRLSSFGFLCVANKSSCVRRVFFCIRKSSQNASAFRNLIGRMMRVVVEKHEPLSLRILRTLAIQHQSFAFS